MDNWVDFIGLVFAFFGALGLVTHVHSHLTKVWSAQIASEIYRATLISKYDGRGAEGYYATLDRLLSWTERFYGRPFGAPAFARCVILGYLYPLFFAMFAWVLWNQTDPGGFEILVSIEAWASRLWRGAFAVAAFVVIYVLYRITWPDWVVFGRIPSRRLRPVLDVLDDMVLREAPVKLILSLILIFFVFQSLFGKHDWQNTVAIDPRFGVFFAFALVYNVIVAMRLSTPSVIIFAACVLIFVSVLLSGMVMLLGEIALAGSLIVFALFLPLTNAVADWLSLGVTQILLGDMQRRRPGAWGLMAHVVADVVAGLLCLAALLGVMLGALELWEVVHPASQPIDWREYWQAAQADWRQGTTLWLICATTLLPSFVHVIWALTLWQTQKTPRIKLAVEKMRHLPEHAEEAHLNEITSLLWWGNVAGVAKATALWLPVIASFMILLIYAVQRISTA